MLCINVTTSQGCENIIEEVPSEQELLAALALKESSPFPHPNVAVHHKTTLSHLNHLLCVPPSSVYLI